VLRACHRILKPGGRLAFTAIQLTPGLAPEDRARALAGAPTFTESEATYPELLERVGFHPILHDDVTAHFGRIVASWLTELQGKEAAVRRIWGDAQYDDTVTRRRAALAATTAGLLQRSLLVAARP
jgi:hypothetical protein